MKKLRLILNLLFSAVLVFSFLLQTPGELITILQDQLPSQALRTRVDHLNTQTKLEFQKKIGSPLFLRISDAQDAELDDELSRMSLDLTFVTDWIHHPITLTLVEPKSTLFQELSPLCFLARMGDRFSVLHAGNSPPSGSFT